MKKIAIKTKKNDVVARAFGPWPVYHPDYPYLPVSHTGKRVYFVLVLNDEDPDGNVLPRYWTDRTVAAPSYRECRLHVGDIHERTAVEASLRSQDGTIVFDTNVRQAAWFATADEAKDAFYARAVPWLSTDSNFSLLRQALLNRIQTVEVHLPAMSS